MDLIRINFSLGSLNSINEESIIIPKNSKVGDGNKVFSCAMGIPKESQICKNEFSDSKHNSCINDSLSPQVRSVQCLTGCPANSGESLGMFYKLAFNGYNMVYLDVNLGIWVAEHPNATQLEYALNEDHDSTKSIQFFLNVVCQPLASSLLWSGKAILKRKLQPEVSFFRHHRDSVDELVCMVTGFYPESINKSLLRNRKHRMDGTVTTGTLPNGDDTYQIVTLVVLDEEEGPDLYCRVEHDSLTEPLMIQLENTKPPAGMITGILIGFILLTAGLSWLVIRCKRHR
ncbi:class I histocompatibility antigen, F10 alpha chain-like [Aquarana catesbeiana]|uniref:class I histocompatibility antigen, F10 alpha chain-like n=1 Tax=Aquarana catesbeiana TaxID=8400 RepID=UPI003CCA40E4